MHVYVWLGDLGFEATVLRNRWQPWHILAGLCRGPAFCNWDRGALICKTCQEVRLRTQLARSLEASLQRKHELERWDLSPLEDVLAQACSYEPLSKLLLYPLTLRSLLDYSEHIDS